MTESRLKWKVVYISGGLLLTYISWVYGHGLFSFSSCSAKTNELEKQFIESKTTILTRLECLPEMKEDIKSTQKSIKKIEIMLASLDRR